MAAGSTAFAQVAVKHSAGILSGDESRSFVSGAPQAGIAAKNTTLSDTLFYYNNTTGQLFDSSVALKYYGITPNDSGYLFGTNTYGDSAFAEMYDFNWGQDTLINVIGVISLWAGHVQPSSTDSLTFHVWDLDTTKYQLDTNKFAWHFPGASLTAKKVPLTGLNLAANQQTITYFDVPGYSIHGNFYVGYSYSYNPDSLNGDTITLHSTKDSAGLGTGQYQVININNVNDTFLTTRNAILSTDGYWYDVYNDYGKKVNLSLVPIFRIRSLTGVSSLSKNGLTLLGNTPNPAVSSTNINFSLQQAGNIIIQLTDVNGKILNTLEEHNLSAGSHSVPLSIAEYPAGNYVYILRTSNGAAMAAIFTVAK